MPGTYPQQNRAVLQRAHKYVHRTSLKPLPISTSSDGLALVLTLFLPLPAFVPNNTSSPEPSLDGLAPYLWECPGTAVTGDAELVLDIGYVSVCTLLYPRFEPGRIAVPLMLPFVNASGPDDCRLW